MKTIYTLGIVLLASTLGLGQTTEFGSNFILSQPVSGMKRDMDNAFGITFDVARHFKSSGVLASK